MGEVKFLLGKQPDGDIWLQQEKYTANVLKRYDMTECRLASTPLPPACKLSKLDSPTIAEGIKDMELAPYKSAVGSMMYLAICTRPDISAAVSALSSFNANPRRAHWEGVQHVLRYLKGTANSGIRYRKGASTDIWGFTDASHLTCPDTSRSRSGLALI